MSGATFPDRLTKVDDLTRPDHVYLTVDDACYFIGEYTARRGYAYSPTNNLIFNFKKPVDRRHLPEWRHKERAIQTVADTFRRALRPEALGRLTFVPIPPSKAKDDPLHDDRMIRMLGAIRHTPPLDVRELILQTRSTEAAHGRDVRPRPFEIEALYRVDETLAEPAPRIVALVDDLLTTGAHFRAATSVLRARFSGVTVIGLFIARRTPETTEFDDFADGML